MVAIVLAKAKGRGESEVKRGGWQWTLISFGQNHWHVKSEI
jgi:hypothetical protein